jgi:hypothetical protein
MPLAKSFRRALIAITFTLALIAGHRPAPAALGEALNTTPTAWWWYVGVTPAQVSSLLTQNNARLVSLQVEQASPLLFTVAMVQNTGSYAKGWYWFYGLTSDQLSQQITNLNARIIDIDVYDSGTGSPTFAAILLPNTGADAKTWWWYFGVTTDQVSTLINQNNGRLIDLHQYTIGGVTRYAVVMISNTGADASAWWWYFGISASQVSSFLQQNGAFLISLEPTDSTGTAFNVIMQPTPPGLLWWWYFGVDTATVSDRLSQNGARLLDVKSYFSGGSRFHTAIMVNNSNAETSRVGQILRNGTPGETGLYLKQVDGPVLANLQEGFQYDPASSIKILIGLHLMKQVDLGNVSLTQTVPIYAPNPDGSSCPVNTTITGSETIGAALTAMLENSDNVRTRMFIDMFGFAALNQTAQNLGMTSTHLSIYPGCGITNQMTLADVAKIYEGIADGTQLSPPSRATLYTHMPIDAGDFTGVRGNTNPMIDQEAASVGGLTAAQVASFKAAFQLHYKAGGDTWCAPNCLEYRAISGTAEIPVCSGTAKASQPYVWGIFIHAATNPGADTTFGAADAEPLREPIHSALAGWAACSAAVAVPAEPPLGLFALAAGLLAVGGLSLGAFSRPSRRRGSARRPA